MGKDEKRIEQEAAEGAECSATTNSVSSAISCSIGLAMAGRIRDLNTDLDLVSEHNLRAVAAWFETRGAPIPKQFV